MKIGFLGLGFVGGSAHNTFKQYVKTETYDLDKSKCSVSSIKALMEECSIIFVAVPTPIREDGSCYLDNIHSVYSKLNKYGNGHIIILKSSVPPGTSKMLNAEYRNVRTVFNPEFLRERRAIEDFKEQSHIILGGDANSVSKAEDVYRQAFPEIPIYKTDTTTAEATKFFINIFLATKVSLANEFYRICEKLEINYDDVKDLALLDQRIGSSHITVPGEGTPTSPKGFGFAGSCFPVNLEILINTAHQLGVDPKIMKAVRDRNNEYDHPSKDWQIEGKTVVYANKDK